MAVLLAFDSFAHLHEPLLILVSQLCLLCQLGLRQKQFFRHGLYDLVLLFEFLVFLDEHLFKLFGPVGGQMFQFSFFLLEQGVDVR